MHHRHAGSLRYCPRLLCAFKQRSRTIANHADNGVLKIHEEKRGTGGIDFSHTNYPPICEQLYLARTVRERLTRFQGTRFIRL